MNAPANWAMPCYPGSPSLPPVICRSYTGRPYAGMRFEDLRPDFYDSSAAFTCGQIDAPNAIPAGSHRAPRITINGKPLIERPSSIFPAEVEREP